MDPNSGRNATDTARTPGAGAPSGDVGGDLLEVLSDVEARLAQLKQSAADREAARRQLDSRETELHRREQALAEQSEKLRVAEERAQAGFRGFNEREESLKKMTEQVERAQRHLDEQRAKVEEAQNKVGEQTAQVARDREAIDAMAAELLDREQALHAQADHGAAKARQEQFEAALAEARKAAEQHDALLKSEHDKAINALKGRAEQAEAALSDARKTAADHETTLNIERERAASALKRAEELGRVADEKQKRVEELERTAGQAAAGSEAQKLLQKTLAERERELEEARAGTWEAREELRKIKEEQEARQSEAHAASLRARGYEHRIAELTRQLEQARAAAGSGTKETESLRAAVEEQRRLVEVKAREAAEAVQRAKALQDELSAAQGETKKFARAADEHGAGAQRAGDLEKKLQAREADVARLTAALEETTGAIRKAESEFQTRDASTGQQLAAARQQYQELARERAQLAEQVQKLSDRLQERENESARLAADISAAGQRSSKAEAVAAELRAQAERASRAEAEVAELRAQIERAESELRCAETAMQESAAGTESLQAQLEEARTRAEGVVGEMPAEVAEIIDRRLNRLRTGRRLLRQRTKKVQEAAEAVRERFERAEQILTQRDELARARGLIFEAQRKVERAQAGAVRSKAASFVLYIVLLLGVLAGMSWAITQEFAPATYAARCTISADGRGRELAPEEVREWYKFHESLLQDPQMASSAAEKMAARGMSTLGTPGAITEWVRTRVTWDEPEPGRMSIELRGRGASRTERELSTFIAAFLSKSNATREQRTDGIATVLAEAVSTGRGPIEDQRLPWALVVFAASAAGSSGLGVVVWRRLAAARSRFEQEAQIDAILDEANWGSISPADAMNGGAPGQKGAARGRNNNAGPDRAGDEDEGEGGEAAPTGRGRRG